LSEYGRLIEHEGRVVLEFERVFSFHRNAVFGVLTNPVFFTQWYPFATTSMDLRVGGKLKFDDGEGSIYEGEIFQLEVPASFCFKEIEDLLEIYIREEKQGCKMTFRHTFDDQSMAMYVAAGWHRCLHVLDQLINGQPAKWEDNAEELREYYKEAFHL